MSEFKNIGSEWQKWDLHIHSPKTFLNKNAYSGVSDDGFVDKIVDSGLKAIGLTNYFKFADGEIDGGDSIKQKLENKGIIVFPNIELRLDKKNKDDEYINVHILFSEKTPVSKIKDFLYNLKTINGKSCRDIQESEIVSQTVSIDSIKSVMSNSELVEYKDVIIMGCPNGYGGFRPESSSSRSIVLAQEIDSISAAVFASHDNPDSDKEFFLDTCRYRGSIAKPAFLASDAHKLEDIGEKFTWVKARASFEGLIQVVYSPKERTSFNQCKPTDIKSDAMIIDRIEYGHNKKIYFNDDLNAIIGTRGNGKSLLLKSLAINLASDDFKNKLSIDRASRDKRFIDKKFQNLKIYWRDEVEGEKEDRKILFLPQGYLSSLAYDENEKSEDRDNFIIDLLRKNQTFRNAEISNDKFLINTMQNINGLIDALLNNQAIVNQNKKEILENGSTNNLELELNKLRSRTKEISEKYSISEAENEKYQDCLKKEKDLALRIEILKQDIDILAKLKDYDNIIDIREYLFENLSEYLIEEISEDIKSLTADRVEKVAKREAGKLKKELKNSQDEYFKNTEELTKLSPKFKKQQELEILSQKISELKSKTEYNKNLEAEIDSKNKENIKNLNELKKNYFKLRDNQKVVFNQVRFDEFNFLKIDIKVSEDLEKKRNFIVNNINTNKLKDLNQKTKDFITKDNELLDEGNFEYIIKDILNDRVIFKSNVNGNKKRVLYDLLENPYKIDFLQSITTKDGKTEFRDMTGGQKAITMLELIFKFDTNNYPILIDQPEDDLDTTGVATSVVDFIKDQKENRQIFMVSHSASLVVCADSDEVIVAENKNNTFNYYVGAIEDPKIREDIINRMEGGREALRLRINKLRIE